MDQVTALHTAARRYCQSAFSEWMHRYSDLQAAGKVEVHCSGQPGWKYSDEAYKMFPRYRIAQAIQVEVERIMPSSVDSLEEMGELLVQASQVPEERLNAQLNNPLASNALATETHDYQAHIRALMETDLSTIEPLPYRRALSAPESERLWDLLRSRWGVGDDHYWFPLRKGDPPPDVVAFHEDLFSKWQGGELLRQALTERGIERAFQLSEFFPSDPDYEIEISILEPTYARGGEQYFTSETADWLVYASHESSITLAGDLLVEHFTTRWPDWKARTYQGPYPTPDLRGTWETK
jgi:hypothetical protein